MQVRIIGRTVPIKDSIIDLASSLGAEGYDVPETDAVITTAGRRCYNSFEPGLNPNVTKTRKDVEAYVANILKSGHGSVLEHVSYTFSIEGLTRVCTAELNRHRVGSAISEASMRYIRLDDGIPFWMPDSLGDIDPDPELLFEWMDNDSLELTLEQKQAITKQIIFDAFETAFMHYKDLLDLWSDELEGDFAAKKRLTSLFRRIIPMGISTGGVWTFNLRALRHIITLRGSEHAEEEIRLLAQKLYDAVIEYEANVFMDIERPE